MHTYNPSTEEANKEALPLSSMDYRMRLVSRPKGIGHERAQEEEHLPSKNGDPRTHINPQA